MKFGFLNINRWKWIMWIYYFLGFSGIRLIIKSRCFLFLVPLLRLQFSFFIYGVDLSSYLGLYLPPCLLLKVAMFEVLVCKNIVVTKFHQDKHVFQLWPFVKVAFEEVRIALRVGGLCPQMLGFFCMRG